MSEPVRLAADILLDEQLDASEGWTNLAECRQYNGDDWYAERGDMLATARAKRICGGCEVVTQCLAYALDRHEPHGVWGGLTAAQRTRLLRAQRKAVASAGERDTSRAAS